jgi:hypothetical protein
MDGDLCPRYRRRDVLVTSLPMLSDAAADTARLALLLQAAWFLPDWAAKWQGVMAGDLRPARRSRRRRKRAAREVGRVDAREIDRRPSGRVHGDDR